MTEENSGNSGNSRNNPGTSPQGPGDEVLHHGDGTGHRVTPAYEAGQIESTFPDPGLPTHVYRRSDIDERAAKRAERQIAGLFLLSFLGSIGFVVAYFAVPLEPGGVFDSSNWQLSNWLLGGFLALAIFAIGVAAVHWAKKLMPDDEIVEERHAIRSTDEERVAAAGVLAEGGEGAGFGRRPLIWGSMLASFGVLLAPVVVLLRDLGPLPGRRLEETLWEEGSYLVRDPEGTRINAAAMPIGGVLHVLPEGIDEVTHPLEEKAKAAVILIRLAPEDVVEDDDRIGWSYEGIVAYSKICTHVGCPVGLYEQQTHHLLCPCHQSTFDVEDHCRVIFGPAVRPLPQLAITVDTDGYLVAAAPFLEPVGPSFWERG